MVTIDCLGGAMVQLCCPLSILCLYDQDNHKYLPINHLPWLAGALFHSLHLYCAAVSLSASSVSLDDVRSRARLASPASRAEWV